MRELLFPYCSRCVGHVRIWETGSMASSVIMLTGISGGIVIALSQTALGGLLVFGAALVAAVIVTSIMQSRARSHCLPSCASGAKAVVFYGWSGSTNTFAFESAAYTARFAEQNATKLASVDPGLRHLLEAHKVARLQVPTPASATRTVPPPRDLKQWLAHLDHQPTRVSRRIAFGRALDVVSDPDERATLVHVVCSAELAPIFARIDGVASSTRRRELQRALSDVRADNIPEELREAELVDLDRRIRSTLPPM
ncbi:MAG: hypothetical protein H0T89_17075 [Deltaproteobacteria bacterium]|nr:hypothetical protein [Deltaproteobacteria bacterium]MDQ3294982.1 hypothetical protein [Myxococcota bacterium]